MLLWAKVKAVTAVVVVSLFMSGGIVLVTKAAETPAPPGLTGTITAVGSGSISIQPAGGQPVAVTINEATVVKVGGKVATAAELKVGIRAAVVGQHISMGQPATEIRAYLPTTPTTSSTRPASGTAPASSTAPALTGTITAVTSGSVTIQPSSGKPITITITINDATVVKVGGQVATAADLKVGMRAAVVGQHLSMGQPATEIRAYLPPAN